MTTLLDFVGYSDWVLHTLIWMPILGIIPVLWADEQKEGEISSRHDSTYVCEIVH